MFSTKKTKISETSIENFQNIDLITKKVCSRKITVDISPKKLNKENDVENIREYEILSIEEEQKMIERVNSEEELELTNYESIGINDEYSFDKK